jgi:hypothetical protein
MADTPLNEAAEDSKQPTTALDQDALFLRFQRWFKEDKPHCDKWIKDAKEDYDFAALRQWNETDKKALEDEQRIPLTFDRTGVVIDSVTGAEVANRQEVRYIPRTPGDAEADEKLTEGARWFRDSCNAEHEESHAFRDTVISGMGWTSTQLDYEENPDGDPKIERVDPLCMYWDHTARKPNLTDARRIWRIFDKMPIEEARAKFEGVDDEDLDALWARSGTEETGEPYDASRPRYRTEKPLGGSDDDEGASKIVTIVEVQWTERETYFRATVTAPPQIDPATGMPAVDPNTGQPIPPQVQRQELTPDEHQAMQTRAPAMGLGYKALKQVRKVHYRAFLGGKVLETGKLFAPPNGSAYPIKGQCPRFGYNCITGKLDRNTGHFFGLMRAMKDPQRFTNKWLSQALHIMNTTSKGGIMAESGAFEDENEAEETWSRPDAITKLKTGGLQKIKEKPVSGFPPQIMQMVEFAISSIRDATGVNAEVLGLRQVDQAASLERQRTQAATTILAPLFDSLRLYRRLQGEVLLYLIVNYLADGRLIRITSDNAAQGEYVPFQLADDAAMYDVIVDDAPTSPNQKEAVWQVFGQIMPFLAKLQVPLEVYMVILESSPLPASVVAEVKQAFQKAEQQAAQQQQQQQPSGPNPADIKSQEMMIDLQGKKQAQDLDIQHRTAKASIDINALMQKKQLQVTQPQHDPVAQQVQQLGAMQAQTLTMLQQIGRSVAQLQQQVPLGQRAGAEMVMSPVPEGAGV